jgi:hypothetical protein
MTSKIAIIVEWDNARLSEVDRAREMLIRLNTQSAEYAKQSNARFELMLVYDPEEIPAEIPTSIVRECIDEKTWPGNVRLVEAQGLPYYEQKNFGVRQTDADAILFVDSDVIPDDGWLELLLDALKNPEVSVVGGETYLTSDSLYEKLFAAFWQFETKEPPGGQLREARGFYANNVAFRGDLLRTHPFPKLETFRGQCAMLGAALRAEGTKIWRHGAARVSHPPPEGFSHFVNRAICHGHDMMLIGKIKNHSWFRASPLGSVWRLVRDLVKAPGRISQRYRKAGLGVTGWVGAFALAVSYYGLKFVGDLMTFFAPRTMRKVFSI